MAERKVAIRLGTEGKAQIIVDMDEIAASGDKVSERWVRAYKRAGDEIDRQVERQQQAAARLSLAVPGLNPAKLDSYAGINDNVGKSAAQSASVFEAAYQRMDEAAARLVAQIDPLYAAQMRYNTTIGEARQLLDAGSLSAERYADVQRSAKAALDQATAAADQQALAVQRASAMALEGFTGVQSGIGKSAAESAAVFSAAYEQMEQRAQRLVALMDPAVAAQQRFDREMIEARTLIGEGVLTLDQYCQKLRLETALLAEATDAQARGSDSIGRTRAAMLNLSYQAQDTFTQLALGANPLQVLAIQGGQAAGAFAGMKGAAGAVADFMIGPWGLALTGGALLLGTLWSKLHDAGDASLTMADQQQVLAKYVDMTTGKIREQVAAVVALAQAQAQAKQLDQQRAAYASQRSDLIGATNITDTRIAESYRFGGSGYAPPATESEQQIEKLGEAYKRGVINANALGVAVKKIGDADPSVRQLTDHIVDLAAGTVETAQAATKTQATIALLTGTATDAQKKILGITVEANTSLLDAQAKLQASTSAVDRAQAQLTITRIKAKAELDANTISEAEYTARIASAEKAVNSAETAQRDHTAALRDAAKATREAIKDQREYDGLLTGLQQKYQPAIAALNAYAKARSDIARLLALPSSNPAHIDAATAAVFGAGAENDYITARAKAFSLSTIESYRPLAQAQDDADKRTARATDFYKTQLVDQKNALDYQQAEQLLIGANDNLRDRELHQLELKQRYLLQFPGLTKQQLDVLLANADAIDREAEKTRLLQDSWEEVTRFGDRFLSDVLDPRNWDNWGDAAKRITEDIEDEFVKLIALNPLKNLLFGESNPTLSSVGGIIGKLLGGGSGTTMSSMLADIGNWGHNAAGTENWQGGPTWLAENGPELVNLPAGARVMSASATRNALAANDRGPAQTNVYQTFHNDFAGGAATQQDVIQMGLAAKQGAISAIQEANRRRS